MKTKTPLLFPSSMHLFGWWKCFKASAAHAAMLAALTAAVGGTNVVAAGPPPSRNTQQVTSLDQVPEGMAKSDWSSIRAAYEAGRHAFQPIDGGWQARNPGQQWTTKFDGRGFVAEPQGGGWQWGLELKSYGFAGKERAIDGQPAVKAAGQRLTYQWDAAVQEWFVNDQRGLEHGFVVKERPSGAAGTELQFDLAVRGSLKPQISADAQGVQFRDGQGATVLTYAGLKVWDADGKFLPSHFVVTEAGVRLLVDERSARYPLTIDPIAQQAYLKASNTGAGDHFGLSVSMSGDIVVVGAFGETSSTTGVNSAPDYSLYDAGAAYVFVRSGTTWTQQAYLKASNTGAEDRFGYSVTVSRDTVVVGAMGEASSTTGVNSTPNESASQSGAAYVFVRSGTMWTQQAYLKASNTGANDFFGRSVAVSGDTLVVGAYREASSTTGVNSTPNEGAIGSGAAYVFVRNGSVWSQQAFLKASNTGANDYFGGSVAVEGGTVVVGAVEEASSTMGVNSTPNESAAQAGAAYVFERNGTTWSQQAFLKASNTGAGDYFGHAVSVSGGTVVVGAVWEDSSTTGVNSTPNDNGFIAGAAYVFVRSGSTWSQQAYLKASNAEVRDVFGLSVSVSGDTLVVGATGEDSSSTGANSTPNEGASMSGAAYVFVRSNTTWIQQAYLKANNTGANDSFGCSVAVAGNTVIVGAQGENSSTTGVNSTPDESANGAGAAYVFTGFDAVAVPTVTAITPSSGSTLGGTSVTITGTNFTGATVVTIGGVAVTSFTVVNATTITATTGARAAGLVNVVVTTPGGIGTGIELYSYTGAPEIDIEQPTGTPLPGAKVTAWGNNNYGATTVPLNLTSVTAITANGDDSGALRSDGTVALWGSNAHGQLNAPALLTGVTAIAAGYSHTIALRNNGTVAAWGDNSFGQLNIPFSLTGVTAIAAGAWHSLALKSNGSVAVWGWGYWGQTNVPFSLTGVQSIAAGLAHSLALRSDGTLAAWGGNLFGQSVVPSALTNVIAIAAGKRHSVALKSNGIVVLWGSNSYHQMDVPPMLSGVKAIAAGGYHTMALKNDGTVAVWGSGLPPAPASLTGVRAIAAGWEHGLALTGYADAFGDQILGTTSVSKSFAIKNSGSGPLTIANVSTVGGNAADFTVSTSGLVASVPALSGVTTFTVTFTPSALGDRVTTLRVASNDADEGYFDITLSGRGRNGVPAMAVFSPAALPLTNCAGVYDFSTFYTGTCSAPQTYYIQNVGTAPLNITSLTSNNPQFAVSPSNMLPIAPGGVANFTITFCPVADGPQTATILIGSNDATVNPFCIQVRGTGRESSEISVFKGGNTLPANSLTSGAGSTAFPSTAVNFTSASQTFTIQNVSNGSLNLSGVTLTGPNAGAFSLVPILPALPTNLASSGNLSFSLNFHPWFVGMHTATINITSNDADENPFLINITGNGLIPVPEIAVFQGTNASLANTECFDNIGTYLFPSTETGSNSVRAFTIKNVGTATLLMGTPVSSNPSDFTIDSFAPSLSPGSTMTFYVRFWPLYAGAHIGVIRLFSSDANESPFEINVGGSGVSSSIIATPHLIISQAKMQLRRHEIFAWGNNTQGQTSIPHRVIGVNTITAGGSHSAAVGWPGGVSSWGDDHFGQIDVPEKLKSLPQSEIRLDGGGFHTVALLSDGTVEAWGDNEFGQATVPSGLTGVQSIAAGGYHTAVVRADHTVRLWGDNRYGQLNQPRGLTNVASVDAGSFHTVALMLDGTVDAWGLNDEGQTTVPSGLGPVMAIAAGDRHTVALLTDGTVTAWGQKANGVTDVPADLKDVIAIAAGKSHTVALRHDGSLVFWGLNTDGQATMPGQLMHNYGGGGGAGRGVRSIAAGDLHTMALVGPQIDFADQTVATPSAVKSFTIMNDGGSALTITGVSIVGDDAASFILNTTAMTSTVAAKGGSTAINVGFLPATVGFRRATLRVATNDPDDHMFDIVLTGTALPVGLPFITRQPVSLTVNQGKLATFGVTATGSGLNYNWRRGKVSIGAPNLPTFSIANTVGTDTGTYSVDISNGVGSVSSDPVMLKVNVPVTITTQALPAIRFIGQSVTFSVIAAGTDLTYQWYAGSKILDNAVNPSAITPNLTLPHVTNLDGLVFKCIVSNGISSVSSSAALVVVDPQSYGQDVVAGKDAVMIPRAYGAITGYQWRRKSTDITGPLIKYTGFGTKGLTIKTAINPTDEDSYTCVISSAAGSLTTGSINLRVLIAPVVDPLVLPEAIMVSQLVSIPVSAVNDPAGFNISGLPKGLIYSAVTGLITGRSLVPGTFTLKVTAFNAAGASVLVQQSNLSILPLPLDVSASYDCSLSRHAIINSDLGGRIKITIASTGALTGLLNLGTSIYPLNGFLNTDAFGAIESMIFIDRTLPESDLCINFTIDTINGFLTGEIEDGTLTGSGFIPDYDYLPFSGEQPNKAPMRYAGYYTLAASPIDNVSSGPEGYSYASCKMTDVTASGAFKLADNTSVTFSGTIGSGGGIPIFSLLYGNTGSLQGTLRIDATNSNRLDSSTLAWKKNPQAESSKSRSFKQGFATLEHRVIGRKYISPVLGGYVMGLAAGPGNARLTFMGGLAPTGRLDINALAIRPAPESAAVLPIYASTVATSGSHAFEQIMITSGAGLVKGTFILVDTSPIAPFQVTTRKGIFESLVVDDGSVQKSYGFFILEELPSASFPTPTSTPYHSGKVLLDATP